MRERTDAEASSYLIGWITDVVFSALVGLALSFVHDAPTWGCVAVGWLTFQTIRNRSVLLDRLLRITR